MIRSTMLRASLAVLAMATPAGAMAETILFVGNSFTYGGHSGAWRYNAAKVTDLNGDGVGGVPAIFKTFTEQAGLDYDVSLETSGGKSLAWHWDNRRGLIDRRWDHVVLQEYSTLDGKDPGNPAMTIDYAGRLASMFAARNPNVSITMSATWSRPDLTYLPKGKWYGQSIYAMALDLRRGYDAAAAAHPRITGVSPVGEAFSCAIHRGVADPNPYDGIAYGQIDLWTYDHYHASSAGYYLEALVVFADVTGKDPRTLGKDEVAASELGISGDQAAALQTVAYLAHRGICPEGEIPASPNG